MARLTTADVEFEYGDLKISAQVELDHDESRDEPAYDGRIMNLEIEGLTEPLTKKQSIAIEDMIWEQAYSIAQSADERYDEDFDPYDNQIDWHTAPLERAGFFTPRF